MIAAHIVPILIVSGVATAGLLAMAIAPRAVSRVLFGVEPADVLSLFLARYAGLLVFLVGCLIVSSAFRPELREPVLIAASVEKLAFVFFVVSRRLRPTPLVIIAAAADSFFVLLYLAYLANP